MSIFFPRIPIITYTLITSVCHVWINILWFFFLMYFFCDLHFSIAWLIQSEKRFYERITLNSFTLHKFMGLNIAFSSFLLVFVLTFLFTFLVVIWASPFVRNLWIFQFCQFFRLHIYYITTSLLKQLSSPKIIKQ